MLFLLFLDVVCLKFLDQKSLLQLFLNCETFVLFLALPFHSKKKIFNCYADWLALSCIEVRFFTEKKDRLMALTKIELQHTQLRRNTSLVTSLSKTGASNRNVTTNRNDCIFYKFILGI
jgi:hypothetical protein